MGIVVVAALAVLSACEYSNATGVSRVSDVSAILHGSVHSDDPTPRFWFEYDAAPTVVDGKLTFASSTPEDEWACCGPMLQASRQVTGLSAGTTYHYRFCIRTESERQFCSAAAAFTTRPADRDVVEGSLAIPIFPQLGAYEGVTVSVRAEPDSSSPVGTASRLPGTYYFRFPDSGDATCLRITGNRAAVGFHMEDPTGQGGPGVSQVVFVEDNGATGDRFGHVVVAETPTACPNPATAAVTWQVAQHGNVTISDHAPPG